MSQWSHLYQNHSWRKRRLRQLAREPLCRFCARKGFVTVGTVADHIVPHKGDPELFAGELQTLCASCHSGVKALLESGAINLGCDANGNPENPMHHWHGVE